MPSASKAPTIHSDVVRIMASLAGQQANVGRLIAQCKDGGVNRRQGGRAAARGKIPPVRWLESGDVASRGANRLSVLLREIAVRHDLAVAGAVPFNQPAEFGRTDGREFRAHFGDARG